MANSKCTQKREVSFLRLQHATWSNMLIEVTYPASEHYSAEFPRKNADFGGACLVGSVQGLIRAKRAFWSRRWFERNYADRRGILGYSE